MNPLFRGTSAPFISGTGGSGTPGGSDTQVQYNNAGSFAGSIKHTWDEANKTLKVNQTFQSNQNSDTAYRILEIIPTTFNDTTGIGSEPPMKKYSMWLSSPNAQGGSLLRQNRVLVFGYNYESNGVSEDQGDAAFGDRWESYWNPTGTERWFERHIQMTSAGAGYVQYRPMSILMVFANAASTGVPLVNFVWNFDQMQFNNTDNTRQLIKLTTNVASAGGNILVYDSSLFLKLNNNQPWFYQANAAGSANKSLIYLDSSDLVQLGATGINTSVVAKLYFTSDSVANLYRSSAGNLTTDGSLTITGALTVTDTSTFSQGFFSDLIQVSTGVANSVSTFGTSPTAFTATATTDRLTATKNSDGSTAIRTMLVSAEFTGTSNSALGFAAINAFARSQTGASANLTLATAGGGLKNRYLAQHAGTGVITQASAVSTLITATNSSGTITDGFGFHFEPMNAATGTTITRGGALWIRDGVAGGGTQSTFYGIRIDALTRGSTANMPIAIGGTGVGSYIYFNATTAVSTEWVGSSAASTMDINANTTLNLKVGTNAILALAATTVTFKDAVNEVYGTTTGTQLGTGTTQKLAFHGSTAVVQRAGAAQNAVATTASTQTTPFGYTTQAQADAIVTLVNELRAALTEKGLIKGSS